MGVGNWSSGGFEVKNRDQILMSAVACALLGGAFLGFAADPYRGLWVGQAKLNYVNEISIALDEDNVSIAPDPTVPTPTADQAQIRLILHVNGAGQVNLLKDVAVLRRATSGETNYFTQSEVDLALVTDERLYSEFPEQEARRIASAVFDFGDIKATEAVDAIVAQVSETVATSVMSSVDEDAAETAAIAASADILVNADARESFSDFLQDELSKTDVDSIAEAADPTAEIDLIRPTASNLTVQSFYEDSRPVAVLDALEAAIDAETNAADKVAAAQNAVARFADVETLYERFIRSDQFGDMIRAVAYASATEAMDSNATWTAINTAARATTEYNAAATDALNAKASAYDDTQSQDSLDLVVSSMVDAALAISTNSPVFVESVASELEADGAAVLSDLQHAVISVDIPSTDYTEFVRADSFLDSANIAAAAAAEAAVFETTQDPFYTETSLNNAARIAATDALKTVYSEAARAHQTELPLDGVLAMGSGDPRLISSITQSDPSLGVSGLTGTIVLPANHPTNPFRHRRHPGHTVGFDIERQIRLDFEAASTNGLERTGLGIDRINGIYREEIFGLHKPLGSNPSDNPIGLKVEGTFELNRISLIDTLNAR